MVFAVHNDGRLPIRLESAFSDEARGDCFWAPRIQSVRTDVRDLGATSTPTRPLPGTVILPGRSVQVSLTGGHPMGGDCTFGALTYYHAVTLTTSVAGRRSPIVFPLTYRFAWKHGALNEVLVEPADVATIPPMPDLVP